MPQDKRNLPQELAGKIVTVLGGGVSGISLALLARDLGAEVFLSDSGNIPDSAKEKLEAQGVDFESGEHSERVWQSDLAVVGSGFPPSADIVAVVSERGVPISGELDFVMPYLKGKFIGITGSNGKTTTTSLTGHLLRGLGFKTAVAGNIGSPLADVAGIEYDYIVAELSSFQLHWANAVRLDGAIVTNLAPDHIDWHGSYENYVAAKAKILGFVKPDGFAIVQQRDVEALSARGGNIYTLSWGDEPTGKNIALDSTRGEARLCGDLLFRFGETSLLGAHNMENVAMSLAAVKLSCADAKSARALLASYVPPPHRCALVAEIDGVRYVDDSKGTNIAATVTALSSIDGTKVIILGGKGKGEDYSTLLPTLREYARWAVLIGEEKDKIAEALDKGGFASYTKSNGMENAVRSASEKAERGDVVLLSPACTSWDMYRNYGERGDHFAAVAKKMGEDRSE